MNESSPLSLEHFQSHPPFQVSPRPPPALTSHSRHYSSHPNRRQLSPASFQEAPVWALCFFYLLSQFSFSAARVVLFNIRYIISLPLPRASLGGSAGKESACNVGAVGSIPGLGRSPEEGKGYPLQYSGLENSMDCIVHGVTESQT